MIRYHGHIIEAGDSEEVREAKSLVADDAMQGADYWIDDLNVLENNYIHNGAGVLVGMEIIVGV